jgi:hypothetical protein
VLNVLSGGGHRQRSEEAKGPYKAAAAASSSSFTHACIATNVQPSVPHLYMDTGASKRPVKYVIKETLRCYLYLVIPVSIYICDSRHCCICVGHAKEDVVKSSRAKDVS